MENINNNKNKIFLVKNFFDYEPVHPVPNGLSQEMITVYLTDNNNTAQKAKELGWDYSVVNQEYAHLVDKMERRTLIAKINSYPKLFISEIIKKYSINMIFISDSNIISMWSLYNDFIQKCDTTKCLYVTSGYYFNFPYRDNIEAELHDSTTQSRWSYNWEGMIDSAKRYMRELESKGINPKDVSIASAKYIGWNIDHPMYDTLSNILYTEYKKNLQGNIILTYMSQIYSQYIYNYFCLDYTNSFLASHNFEA